MRKLVIHMMTTADGYFEGPGHEIDWHDMGADLSDYETELFSEIGILVFGRVTYQLMAGYWGSPEVVNSNTMVSRKMNELPKIVFSATLREVTWTNSALAKGSLREEIIRLKEQQGGDIAVFGSSNLCESLLREGLVDELRLLISPILLGSGHSLFQNLGARIPLKLVRSRLFGSTNMLLCYEPAAIH